MKHSTKRNRGLAVLLILSLALLPIFSGMAQEGLPLQQVLDSAYAGRSVSASGSAGGSPKAGDSVHLSAGLSGFDGLAYSIQWQTSSGGWSDIGGATGTGLSITLNEGNARNSYRVKVTVTGAPGAAAGSVESFSNSVTPAPNGLVQPPPPPPEPAAPAPAPAPEPAPAPAAPPPPPPPAPEAPAEEPKAPVEEPEAPVEEPNAIAEEPEVPVVEPLIISEEPEAPAEEPEAPAEEPETPAEEPEVSAEVPEVPTEEPDAPAEELESPAEEPIAAAMVIQQPTIAEAEAAVVEEDKGILIQEILDAQYPGRKISIYAKWADMNKLEIGNTITLTAVLSGYEGLVYTQRWQVATEGSNYQDVSGANGLSHTFILDEQNYYWSWRIAVDIAAVQSMQ